MNKKPPIAELQALLLAMHPLGPLFTPQGGGERGENLALDDLNAGDPGMERRIHAEYSYGRQLETVIAAVQALSRRLGPEVAEDPALCALEAMAARMRTLRAETQTQRLQAAKHAVTEMAAWHETDPEGYRDFAAHVAATLDGDSAAARAEDGEPCAPEKGDGRSPSGTTPAATGRRSGSARRGG